MKFVSLPDFLVVWLPTHFEVRAVSSIINEFKKDMEIPLDLSNQRIRIGYNLASNTIVGYKSATWQFSKNLIYYIYNRVKGEIYNGENSLFKT